MPDKLATIVDCSWGLILLEVWHTRSTAVLLRFKETMKRLGYAFAIRIYVDAGHWNEHGLDSPAVFFWRGHPWLDNIPGRPWPTLRQLLDICKANQIGILPVVTTFHPGFPGSPDGYNEERHTVDRHVLADIWRTLHRHYGQLISFGCIDNEPLSGKGAYTVDEYKRRVFHERQVLEQLNIIPIIHKSANQHVEDDHFAIGRPEHAFPRPRRSMSENWLLPRVPGSQYAAFVDLCRKQGDVILIGLNFGADFIPARGLKWGAFFFGSTWLWLQGDWTQDTGLPVLEALTRPESKPTPQPEPEEPDLMTRDQVEDVLDQLNLAISKEPPLERVRQGASRRKERRARQHTNAAAEILRNHLAALPSGDPNPEPAQPEQGAQA